MKSIIFTELIKIRILFRAMVFKEGAIEERYKDG